MADLAAKERGLLATKDDTIIGAVGINSFTDKVSDGSNRCATASAVVTVTQHGGVLAPGDSLLCIGTPPSNLSLRRQATSVARKDEESMRLMGVDSASSPRLSTI